VVTFLCRILINTRNVYTDHSDKAVVQKEDKGVNIMVMDEHSKQQVDDVDLQDDHNLLDHFPCG
jgi:hypothetical protein